MTAMELKRLIAPHDLRAGHEVFAIGKEGRIGTVERVWWENIGNSDRNVRLADVAWNDGTFTRIVAADLRLA